MTTYLLCFSITTIFAAMNEYTLQKKNKLLIILTAILVIVTPAILAGVRSYEIGTDVNYYVRRTFELSTYYNSINDWLSTVNIPGFITQNQEKGFLILEYLVSRISLNTHFFLFIVAIIENIFVYLALYKLRNNCSIIMGEIIFLFTQYNSFYNMVRQGIAMSICLFAVALLLSNGSRNKLKFLFWILVAIQFHSTAIVSLVFILIYYVFKNEKSSVLKQSLLVIILLIFIVSLVPLTQYAVRIGIFPDRYLEYFNGGTAYNIGRISVFGIVVYWSGAVVLFQGARHLGKNQDFYIAVTIIDMLLILLTNVSFYLFRVSAYFLIIRILSMSQKSLYNSNSDRKFYENAQLLCIESIFSVVLYFLYFIVYLNWHQTIPYIFMNY